MERGEEGVRQAAGRMTHSPLKEGSTSSPSGRNMTLFKQHITPNGHIVLS